MSQSKTKKLLARKYVNKPEDTSHKYYEPERLILKWKNEGKSQDEIKQLLTEYVLEERNKCINDVLYFSKTYGFIAGPGAMGIIPFNVEKYQEDLLVSFQNDKYIIAVKARQLGVSTALVFFALWASIFSTGKRCLVVAHRRESAEEFVTKLKTAYEFLPEWLKPACTLYSKNTVEFETKSVVKAITSNPHAARSFSATVFLVDEAAFIKDADDVIKGILPTISASDGKLIAISTPNGNAETNWFYRTVTLAKQGLNGWKCFELPWTVSSIFSKNPKFREDQIRIDNGNEDKFKQEYELCFDVNLSCLFNKRALNAFMPSSRIINKVQGGLTYEDTFFIWKMAEPNKRYVIGVDCASNKATAKDFTGFQVLDEDTYEQVAEYMGKLPTEVMCEILVKTATHYNNALLVIEDNSYSDMLFYLLDQKRYTNIWYAEGKDKPGYNTNRSTRIMLIEKLVLFYNNPINTSKLKSVRLKMQMENFSVNSTYSDGSRKFEAIKGNDDLVLSLALALIPLTPKEFVHRPSVDSAVIAEGKSISSGKYSEEYIQYHSERMGVSAATLESRLKIYHDIKNGTYDGSGLEDLNIQHPVEEFERSLAAKEFIGADSPMISDNLDKFTSMLPTGRKFNLDDIFDERMQLVYSAHRNFLFNNF